MNKRAGALAVGMSVVMAVGLLAGCAGAAHPPQGHLETVTLESQVLDKQMTSQVYLPQGMTPTKSTRSCTFCQATAVPLLS